MSKIFISFASQDLKVAMTLCQVLEARGFQCWISARDIQPGENFQVSIVQAIRNAKAMLLVFTENSNNSQEMTKELALASQQKLMVVPLRVEDVTPNDAFAYEFATRQWIDCFADWEFAIDQLARRLGAAIGVQDPKHPATEAEPVPVAAPIRQPVAAVAARRPAPAPNKPPPEPVQPVEPPPPRAGFSQMLTLAAAVVIVLLAGFGIVAPMLKARQAAPVQPVEASAPVSPPASDQKPPELMAAALTAVPTVEAPVVAATTIASTPTSALKAPDLERVEAPAVVAKPKVTRRPTRHDESKLPY
jgi:hypothetical protein